MLQIYYFFEAISCFLISTVCVFKINYHNSNHINIKLPIKKLIHTFINSKTINTLHHEKQFNYNYFFNDTNI